MAVSARWVWHARNVGVACQKCEWSMWTLSIVGLGMSVILNAPPLPHPFQVDVMFPASPLLLWSDPEVLRQIILPIFDYANNQTYKYGFKINYTYAFAPHHLGYWPSECCVCVCVCVCMCCVVLCCVCVCCGRDLLSYSYVDSLPLPSLFLPLPSPPLPPPLPSLPLQYVIFPLVDKRTCQLKRLLTWSADMCRTHLSAGCGQCIPHPPARWGQLPSRPLPLAGCGQLATPINWVWSDTPKHSCNINPCHHGSGLMMSSDVTSFCLILMT